MSNAASLHTGMVPYPGCRLIQLLGKGGYGEVWEAETGDAKRVALKFLSGFDSHASPREIRAIQTVSKLRHPHLTHTDRVWTFDSYIVIQMELADASLQDMLDAYEEEMGTPVEPGKVCLYLSQAAQALDFLNAHQHIIDGQRVGLQHCDIKPSNLLLFGEDTVKLADFGLAVPTRSHVEPHRRAGTPGYAAPEVFEGRISDYSDQYSLAVTYCELRVGRLPFPPIDDFRDSWPRRRPEPDLSQLSARERLIIARALKREPQGRWPSSGQMMTELTQALSRNSGARPRSRDVITHR